MTIALVFGTVWTLALSFGTHYIVLAQVAAPDPDVGALVNGILGAVQGRNWTIVVGLALTGITFLVRKFGSKLVPWLSTDRGGAALALGVALLGTLGTVLAGGGHLSVSTLGDALAMAFTSAGGYALMKKLANPKDNGKPAEVKDLPPTPPLKPTGFVTLWILPFVAALFLLFGFAAHADESPKFGGCVSKWDLCFAPSVSVNVVAMSLRTGDITSTFDPGIGYGATLASSKWYKTGISATLSFPQFDGKKRVQPALVFSFAEYARLGIACPLYVRGGFGENAQVLLGFGADFGASAR